TLFVVYYRGVTHRLTVLSVALGLAALGASFVATHSASAPAVGKITTRAALAHNTSAPLAQPAGVLAPDAGDDDVAPQAQAGRGGGAPSEAPHSAAGAKVEQTTMGTKPAVPLLASFDGLGVGFEGPQGTTTARNPSDNGLAVGPNHIVQTVNSRMA